MELKFTVGGRISKPVAEVFEAVVDPAQLSEFFTTGGARGRIEAGAEVSWDFHDFPGAFPVLVQEVVPNEKVVLQWEAGDDARTWTTVTITFQELEDGRTHVRINEFGWPGTETGLKSCLGNCEGWTGMLCAMKVWLENGIRLRDGFYK
ncbi:ATPase [Labrenzia sp. C1B10]|uniref:SRPBCC family protein n=1 Tax=unclassified Labrenzia TaxID=2648686 RepID=UPI0003B89515|nr:MULTISPECIES: SRPBCC family protein [unclassified Labrenzia]ERP90966.1 ATPase [Labrenzia sp. C1B10]ERS08694.1 ATPase [Labrenzia sp. C1B70]